jgi:hypothetical protein
MRFFLSERELARRRWRYFGRPYLALLGFAALTGLAIGVVWVIAGILHFHPVW